jgi:nuclear pore complex protein Nup155
MNTFSKSGNLDLFCLQTDVFSMLLAVSYRFYEAVVRLPLQRAQALDSNASVINGQIDARHHDTITAQRVQCYEIVMNALRTLKGAGRSGTGPVIALDPASRSKCIKQIIQLSVQWPDTAFHEHLYRTLIELGLDNELLEYGGSDLVAFLQSAGRKHQEVIPKNQLVLLDMYLLCWLNLKFC